MEDDSPDIITPEDEEETEEEEDFKWDDDGSY
jgi:hypothetical protein